MKKFMDFLYEEKEFLEVSFNEEYKAQQKQHPSLSPMVLSSKLMELITTLPIERLGSKGEFFFDDSIPIKKKIEGTLTKSKKNKMNILKQEKELSDIKQTINVRRNSVIRPSKTIIPSLLNFDSNSNSDKKIIFHNLNQIKTDKQIPINTVKEYAKKNMYFENMLQNSGNENKKKISRRLSMLNNNSVIEKNKKKFKL